MCRIEEGRKAHVLRPSREKSKEGIGFDLYVKEEQNISTNWKAYNLMSLETGEEFL